jgi:hypothetical protein
VTPDEEHLRLLSIFHYVVAAILGLIACFPIIHFVIGIVIILAPEKLQGGDGPPPELIGWFFAIFAGLFIVMGWTSAALVFAAGRCLAKRTNYMFCLVVAGLECLWAPFGTVLGVFTIIVLMRDSVKQLFAANRFPNISDAPSGGSFG